ncbi:hypothetical protein SCA6_000037, partial [Theobroma cacao]
GSSISELGELQHLHGTLSILNLQNVGCSGDALKADLKGKKKLQGLVLSWGDEIEDYSKDMFVVPLFMEREAEVPKGFPRVTAVGSEFYGNGSSMKSFDSLEILRFENMPEWKKWLCLGDENGTFCSLQELYIIDCPKLKGDLPKTLPLLRKFRIENCETLGSALSRAPDMHELKLVNCDKMQLQALPTELQNLAVENCSVQDSSLELMLQHCTRLEGLSIGSCASLKSLPEGRLPVSLKRLMINNCAMEVRAKIGFELVKEKKSRVELHVIHFTGD